MIDVPGGPVEAILVLVGVFVAGFVFVMAILQRDGYL